VWDNVICEIILSHSCGLMGNGFFKHKGDNKLHLMDFLMANHFCLKRNIVEVKIVEWKMFSHRFLFKQIDLIWIDLVTFFPNNDAYFKGPKLILDGRSFLFFGHSYGRNLNNFSFSGFSTDEKKKVLAIEPAEILINF
jgi:hypothetical protein